MRYPPDHKAAARAKLIEAGGSLAKKAGFGSTGMDALAAAAGVTTGAVYSQFRSKGELLNAIVQHELARVLNSFEGKTGKELQRALGGYLSPHHATHPETGCPIPALGAEIARADDETRQNFETAIVQLVNTLEKGTDEKEKAWALLAQSIGGIILARAVLNTDTRDEILQAVQNAGLNYLKPE